ncbi:MAG TPA: DUF5710 domain-containing protein [Telluria sp.]|jgi:hypothetical protein
MNTTPPFAPPFQPLSPEFARAMQEHVPPAEAATSPGKSALPGKGAGRPAATVKEGVLYLVVPFAEKDEAKRLGARWDAAARKWYAPSEKEGVALKRWLPKA